MELLKSYLPNFLFILLRAGIVLNLLPVFGSKTFPAQFRIGLAVAFSLVLTPVVQFPVENAAVPVIIIREVMFGMIFGLGARMIFFTVDMAGQIMSNATGLSIATVFNPEIGQSTEIARLYGIVAILLFLALDMHHDLITVFVKSYEWLPAGSPMDPGRLSAAAVSFTGSVFTVSLKLAAPVMIIMLISHVMLGFISRVVPQINILFVGFPIYLVVGFLVMILGLPVFITVLGGYFSSIKDELMRLIVVLKG